MKTLRTVSILAAAFLCTAAFGQKNYDWYKAPAEREVRRAIADWQDLKFGTKTFPRLSIPQVSTPTTGLQRRRTRESGTSCSR